MHGFQNIIVLSRLDTVATLDASRTTTQLKNMKSVCDKRLSLHSFLIKPPSAGNRKHKQAEEKSVANVIKAIRQMCISSPCCSFHVVKRVVSAAADEAAMPLRFEIR